jgi:hypothetical protein
MITCPNCGNKNHEGALFCEACGVYFHTGGSLATNALPTKSTSVPGPSGFPGPIDPAGGAPMLLVLTSEPDTRRFVIDPRTQTALIGRSDPNAKLYVDVDLTGKDGQAYGVSRRHARVHYISGHYEMEDVESLNGTYINGRKMRPYLSEVLHEGDEVKLGDLTLKVSLENVR